MTDPAKKAATTLPVVEIAITAPLLVHLKRRLGEVEESQSVTRGFPERILGQDGALGTLKPLIPGSV